QARSPEAIDTHVNASLTALNLAKVTLEREQSEAESLHFSLASFKSRSLNEHLLYLFIEQFELEPTLIKLHPNYRNLLDYGVIVP
ncbi:MAG: IS4 family transposase, partial [Cyanobacteria bacterium P01_G01_bin.54]